MKKINKAAYLLFLFFLLKSTG
ncbi:Hypothetical Protein MfeM64YM_0766 [Mycoplasmopsis fermentans M64]|uniref:Uncharacterized protein n=1 Tax=Mycoplasmopsis fermentans (strain M64) TaxID=943945 RepID=A0AB32XCX7_MYCFM|nr:Hypothetical Protein MfeM64YM_0766 [Mycoplasmopsis fermentans M64]